MLHRPKLWKPERDCIRLRSVGCIQDKLSRRSAQEATQESCADVWRLKRLHCRQYHNDNQENRWYLIDNTKEFLGVPIPVVVEFIYPMRK